MNDHVLAMVPESVHEVAAVLFDVRSGSFSTTAPPGDPNDRPFDYQWACATRGTLFLRTPHATVWAYDGRRWIGSFALAKAQDHTHRDLCNPHGYYLVGRAHSLVLTLTSGKIVSRKSSVVGLEPLFDEQVVRTNTSIFAASADGELAAVDSPPGLANDEPLIGAKQRGEVIDLVVGRAGASTSIRVISFAGPT